MLIRVLKGEFWKGEFLLCLCPGRGLRLNLPGFPVACAGAQLEGSCCLMVVAESKAVCCPHGNSSNGCCPGESVCPDHLRLSAVSELQQSSCLSSLPGQNRSPGAEANKKGLSPLHRPCVKASNRDVPQGLCHPDWHREEACLCISPLGRSSVSE